MKICIVIFFLMHVSACFGYYTEKDTLNSKNKGLSRLLKLPQIEASNVEIRIFHSRGITNGGQVIVLRNKDLKWEAYQYKYYYKVGKRRVKDKLKKVELRSLQPKSDWNELWEDLKEVDILTLPDDSQIEDKKKGPPEYDEIRKAIKHKRVIINDGEGYDVEIKFEDRIRYYSYSNPEAYLEHFPQVEELQHFSGILQRLQKEFDIEL